MKILQLCNKPPLPSIDGGCKAMHQTTQMLLSKKHSVKVFAISTPKHPFVKNNVDDNYLQTVDIETVFVDTTNTILGLLKNLFTKVPYNVSRFYDIEVEKKIQQILLQTKFDIIIFESVYMAEYFSVIQKLSTAKIFLRSHNIEYLLWQKRAESEKNLLKKIYTQNLAFKLKLYESNKFKTFKNIICITADDESEIKKYTLNNNTCTIPFAAQEIKTTTAQKYKPTFYHLGAMDWQPNIDAINWTLENILPEISKTYNNFQFFIAGKEMPSRFFDLQSQHFFVSGQISNPSEFIQLHDVLIAPIFSGGGMRVKIIEAMQQGKVVVTTALGAAGIPSIYKNNVSILIAETPKEFCAHIEKCITDYEFRKTISENAKSVIENLFGYNTIASKLDEFITS